MVDSDSLPNPMAVLVSTYLHDVHGCPHTMQLHLH